MKLNSYQIGKQAENIATNYLISHNFNIIDNNYKTEYGEIDIIASKDQTLIAIEVKTRKNSHILPYCISQKQRIRIQNALLYFITENPNYNSFNLRFDVILLNGSNKIEHVANAWLSEQ